MTHFPNRTMKPKTTPSKPGTGRARRLAASAVAALLAACTSTPLPPEPPLPPVAPQPALPPVEVTPPPPPAQVSQAKTPREYRRDAASHVYGKNAGRIYRGKMPPLLYAIGVLQVELDQQGQVTGLSWMRAPRHAPEVIAEIEPHGPRDLDRHLAVAQKRHLPARHADRRAALTGRLSGPASSLP